MQIRIRNRYNVIACAYPWRDHAISGGTTPPAFPSYWPEWGGRESPSKPWMSKPQNTPEYGREVLRWCKQYGVRHLAGYWSGHPDTLDTLRHFKDSLLGIPLSEFGDVRLCYNFETSVGPARLEAAIMNNIGDLRNERYTRITDANGQQRPLILMWGDTAGNWPAAFRDLVTRVRNHCVNVLRMPEPFILPTQHLIHANRPEIFESVDGFYRHSFALVPNTHRTTAEATPGTEAQWKLERDLVRGRVQPRTGLPLVYVPGVMPQFAKGDKGGDHYRRLGWVEAKNKGQVLELFRRMKPYAPMTSFRIVPTGIASLDVEIDMLVAVTSWAEWAEASCLEPCWAQPVGDGVYRYGHDFLEALAETFAPAAQAPISFGPVWASLVAQWRKVGESPSRPGVPDDFDLRFAEDGTFLATRPSPPGELERGQVLNVSGNLLRLWSHTRRREETLRVLVRDEGGQLSLINQEAGFNQTFERVA